MRKWPLGLLAVVIVIQLGVVLSLIGRHEKILKEGTVYQFKTRPIDPADPFQGRYVRLSFQSDFIASANELDERPLPGERVYVSLSSDSEGFCELSGWSRARPDDGAYLRLRYLSPRTEWNSDTRESLYKGLAFDLPFNRFYMEESKAPQAESEARRATRNTNCWAAVRIYRGTGLIEDLYVNGRPIRKLL